MKSRSVWVLGVVLCGAVSIASAKGHDDNAQEAVAPANVPTNLPLKRVVLFSSGVGYFGREGRVNGGEVTLSLSPGQVNDVLKSLVLFDPSGGVKPITYSIADYVTNRPRNNDLHPAANLSLGGILQGFQGARVHLDTAGGAIEGRILSVSTKSIHAKEGDAVQIETLNLLTATGLRAVSLEEVTQIKLLDEALDAKLRSSLERMAGGLTQETDDGKRPVRLHFAEGSAREVRAGYLQEMPVWKTSYRLVLDDKSRPFIQGWGQIENTTDEDWQNVDLSLVSGRPISFIQDLYQPLYVPRPVVASQVVGSTIPQTYSATLGSSQENSGGLDSRVTALENRAPAASLRSRSDMRGGNGAYLNSDNFQSNQTAQAAAVSRGDIAASAEQLAKSAAAQAQGSEKGELFEYAIAQPISVPRGEAAMVPIVAEPAGGEMVDIYDPTSDAKCALNGFRFVNTSGLHLAGGPITVFRDGVYAGDAQFTDIAPNEARLISYSVDLDMVVGRATPQWASNHLTLAAKSGVLTITQQQRVTQTYTFRNKSDRDKNVIVQQAIDTSAKLITPEKPFEQSPTQYRFKVAVPAKKSTDLTVTTERPVSQTVALLDADLNLLVSYVGNGEVSPQIKAALGEIVARRRKITALQGQRVGLETELKTISADQDRIRSNMNSLNQNSDLYKQYVAKLTAQETRIDKVQTEIERLKGAEADAQSDLRTYLDGLDIS